MNPKGPLIPTLFLAAGIAAGYLLGLPWWSGIVPIAIGIAIYLYILCKSRNPVVAFRFSKWHHVWVALIFMGIGLTDESFTRPLSLEQSYGEDMPYRIPCEVTGILSKTYGDRIDVKLINTNGAKARLRSGVTDLSPGDIVLVPKNVLVEISTDTTEVGRRIAPMLKANGILYSGHVLSTRIERVGKSSSVPYFFSNIRENIESKIEKSHLAKATAVFINAILMGDKTGLDETTRLTFAGGGIAHLLALSGLHLGVIAGFLLIIGFPLKFTGNYKWGYVISLILLWTYVILTGMAYSSVRACIMVTLAYLAIILERKNFASNALYSSCMLILLFDPSALFDAGFQLSVVCVGALIAFASPLNPIRHREHPLLFALCGALIATIVATGASWVLTSYYFSQIPLMFLPANLIFLPLFPVYLIVAMVFVAFLCSGVELHPLGAFLDHGYNFMLSAAEKLSGGTEFVVDYHVPLPGVLVWIGLLFFSALMIYRKPKKE